MDTLLDLLLHGRAGRLVRPGPAVAEGGEAVIHRVRGDATRLAKLFHAPNPARARLLAALLARPPRDPSLLPGHRLLAWPEDLLHDAAGRPVGLLLPAVAARGTLAHAASPRLRPARWPDRGFADLVSLAASVAAAVAALHDQGFVFGDLKPENVLVDADFRPTFVDCDSMRPLGGTGLPRALSAGYAAPESLAQGGADPDPAGALAADRFALAVLLGELLVGRRPAAGWEAGLPAPDFLGPGFGDLMGRAIDGPAHERPGAHAWHAVLGALMGGLSPCADKPWHDRPTGRPCPWCTVERATSVVLFPAPPAPVDPVRPLKRALERALMRGDRAMAETLARDLPESAAARAH